MRSTHTEQIEKARITQGDYGTQPYSGLTGAFVFVRKGCQLRVISNDSDAWKEFGLPGIPWEHVSVTIGGRVKRCPTWEEMEYIKRIFWAEDETVIQLHVPVADHISLHDYCLHLWKPVGVAIPLPPKFTVA